MSEASLPTVAIVGRPNVGKSSLFNVILGRRLAIVHEQCGVTRDRIISPTVHRGRHFLLVDTGGLGLFGDDRQVGLFDGLIRTQVEQLIGEADCLVWLVDARDGIVPLDREIAALLRQAGRPLILVANKADNAKLADAAMAEFATLGAGPALPVSCTHQAGFGDLLDQILANLPDDGIVPTSFDSGFKLAVVGRPNVGKSSLVNKLLGENRVIVSDLPGTTRDAIDVPITIVNGDERVPMTLIDTAGLRPRRRADSAVELFATMRSESAIKRCDVAVLVLDATEPGTAQDRRIARLIADQHKPCVIAANKWDLAGGTRKLKDLREELSLTLKFMDYAPVVGVSALSGYSLSQIVGQVLSIREQLGIRVPTAMVNQFLADVCGRTPPPAGPGGKHLKILYGTMAGNAPPHFVLFVNDRRLCPPNYLGFLENKLREAFFSAGGMPIRLDLRSRRETDGELSGTRQAAAGVQRRQQQEHQAKARHSQRHKGWRKK